ncbi:hypothetical protein FB567DRAFT_196345 [Paraphoma chrysanthemicola]|uniref:Uncharacterized protein n=1 Tax=Paraphoma chrysanthemicola TaxID=798071 RepID=A0A8K0QX35_9PLEO|nr:hypothetical protein FB567DRAFT_196345 [Paraphoma chrysanthemicola]
MDDPGSDTARSRDDSSLSYDLSDVVHGVFLSRATTFRRVSPARGSNKRKSAADSACASSPSIKLARGTTNPSWLPQTKRSRLQTHHIELHQSTCLNLNMANGTTNESDLWILPDFDDWELESEAPPREGSTKDGDWAPLLRRAASSNRERLRARLEGDGWDFVGGKYGEDEQLRQEATGHGEESLDDEFDVVVLPVVHVSC